MRVRPEFNISLNETQRILEKFAESKIDFIILNVDLVGSTKLSETLLLSKEVIIYGISLLYVPANCRLVFLQSQQ